MEFELAEVKKYLENRFRKEVEIEEVKQLTGKSTGAEALKQFGYGRPILVSCGVGDQTERLVFHRVRSNAFGREREDDRVAAVWLDFKTFNRLPRHVPAVDIFVRSGEGKMESIHGAETVIYLAELLTGNGVNVLISATAPRGAYRDEARKRMKRFAEVYFDCPKAECRKRDPKGLWEQANQGEITELPGAGVLYEPPDSPEVEVNTAQLSIEKAAHHVLNRLEEHGFFQL